MIESCNFKNDVFKIYLLGFTYKVRGSLIPQK